MNVGNREFRMAPSGNVMKVVTVVGLLATVTPAWAGTTAVEVQKILAGHGSKGELHERKAGDPYLDVTTSGISWRLYFVECTKDQPQACASMTAQAAFKVASKGLDGTNEWNASHRFSRAFVDDDGAPTLASDMVLTDVPPSEVESALVRWIGDMERFREFLR
jgi:hypothetical protein